MNRILCFSLFFALIAPAFLFPCNGFSQNQNGLNLQSKTGRSRMVFIPENSRMKVRLHNGSQVSGKLTGADSGFVYITQSTGKQVKVDNSAIEKFTVFHDREYMRLTGSMIDGVTGCDCSMWDAVFFVLAVSAVATGEILFDLIADASNDEHYDLQRNWSISGPVVAHR